MSASRIVRAAGAVLAASITASGLAACSDNSTGPRSLRIALSADPQCLDPHQAPYTESLHVGRQLVANLTDQDPQTGEIVPWIATEWTVSDDATRFRFTLRDDATFSDGTPIDAAAVAANFEDLRDLGAKSPFGLSYVSGLRSIEIPDARTVEFAFDAPNAQFLQATSMVTTGLLAPATLETSPEERCTGQLIGSGPFVLDEYAPNASATLSSRTDYSWPGTTATHTGAATIERLEFSVMTESGVRSGALQTAQIDVDTDVQAQDESALSGAGIEVFARARPGIVYTLLANDQSPALSDPAVRRAVNHAIDRPELASVLSQHESYATSVLSAATPGYVDLSADLAYGPDRAATELDAAGWLQGPDGIRVREGNPLTLRLVFAATETRSDVYEIVQQQLARVGVDLQLVPLHTGANLEAQNNGDYDFVCWAVTRPDPEVLNTVFSSASAGNPNRRTEPARIDELLDELGGITEPSLRQRLTDEAAREVIDQGYAIPLVEQSAVVGTSASVDGIVLDASSRPLFYGARFAS
ncbi:ABC transporter substrate-binding protein [Rhodococcus artemisiae]|uniref:ABC transporter substrate-binding protein n=1 Tax=Rhodococcus artemisiae TaxID=714159 RepID=A0ABU7LGK4_9NOCA|nr:ABC transporter substrate-binding protein [Rhodococcus artemisiae]MEE2060695.1 ABC transporter substrate-binding protein [Rhodococcus artemisiae]